MSVQKSAFLGLLGVSVLWGCNYVASAYLLGGFSPIFLSFARLCMTTLFLLATAFQIRGLRRPTNREWLLLAGVGVFGTLLNQIFYFTGLRHSTAANASLIIGLTPVATILLERMIYKVTFTTARLAGVILGLTGIVVIVGTGGGLHASPGDLNLIVAMIALSVSIIFVRGLARSMSSFAVTIFSTVLGAVLMAPAAGGEALLGQSEVSHSLVMWGILAAAGIIAQGMASFWWNRGVAVLGAGTAAMFMNVPPFIAILLGHFLLHDPIQGSQIIGGVLILAGVFVANQSALFTHRRLPPDHRRCAPATDS